MTVIFDGEISVDDRMAIADLAAAASEQSGVQVEAMAGIGGLRMEPPPKPINCNPSLIAKTKRSGVPAEFVVDGQADRRAGSPRPRSSRSPRGLAIRRRSRRLQTLARRSSATVLDGLEPVAIPLVRLDRRDRVASGRSRAP